MNLFSVRTELVKVGERVKNWRGIMKNKYVLLVLAMNVAASIIASEKAINKAPQPQERYAMSLLRDYLNNLEKQRLQRNSSITGGADLQHGSKYVGVNGGGQVLNGNQLQSNQQRFGRGSSGNNAKL